MEHGGYGTVTTLPAASAATDPKETDMLALADRLYQARRTEALKFQEVVTLARTEGLFPTILTPGSADTTAAEKTGFGRLLTAQDQRTFPGRLRFVIIGKGHARRYAVQKLAVQSTDT